MRAASRHGVERLMPDAALLLSHALQLRLRTLLEKMSVITEHRCEIYRVTHAFCTFILSLLLLLPSSVIVVHSFAVVNRLPYHFSGISGNLEMSENSVKVGEKAQSRGKVQAFV